jgi:hypothetical protein
MDLQAHLWGLQTSRDLYWLAMRLSGASSVPRTDPRRYTDPVRGVRTRQETSRLCGCGVVAVDQLMDDGILGFVQIGNRRLPTVASIERLLGKTIAELEAPLHATTSEPSTQKDATHHDTVSEPV